MSKRETIARYNLIINKLRKYPAAFDEIEQKMKDESELQGYNFIISKRTFQRDLEDIRSLYHIDIQYDFSRKVYYIVNPDQQQEVNERILEAFDTFNALHISDRLSHHIHFEKRRPQGTENLYGLLHAIKNELEICFTYMKFGDDELTHRIARPYALKEFKNRWYVIASDVKDKNIKSFALDRLTELIITRKKFEHPQGFCINKHFKYCFGIISPNSPTPQEIVLSFDPLQGKYIKSLPLHETQHILRDDSRELRISLTLFITHDFLMEMLSFAENVKVIKPASLKKELRKTFEKALKQYQ